MPDIPAFCLIIENFPIPVKSGSLRRRSCPSVQNAVHFYRCIQGRTAPAFRPIRKSKPKFPPLRMRGSQTLRQPVSAYRKPLTNREQPYIAASPYAASLPAAGRRRCAWLTCDPQARSFRLFGQRPHNLRCSRPTRTGSGESRQQLPNPEALYFARSKRIGRSFSLQNSGSVL